MKIKWKNLTIKNMKGEDTNIQAFVLLVNNLLLVCLSCSDLSPNTDTAARPRRNVVSWLPLHTGGGWLHCLLAWHCAFVGPCMIYPTLQENVTTSLKLNPFPLVLP